mmetsp:Transcript_76045/g.204048  ORF Transcript_76045/g.204048 Transcript_76045/m.204048 type:complete len:375 (+) Transcript_76045:785-1909(+)
MPGLLIVSFNSVDMDPAKSQTRSLVIQSSLNLDKLDAVDDLAGRIVTGECDFPQAKARLNEILMRAPYYTMRHLLLAFATSGAMATMMFFGGGYWEGLVSFVLGLWVCVLNCLAGKDPSLASIQEFVTAFTCAVLARVTQTLMFRDLCFSSVALGSVVWLLPGLQVTTSVTELASRSIVSGSSRIFHGFTVTLQLGFGLTFGSHSSFIWNKLFPAGEQIATKEVCGAVTLPLWFQIPGFLAMVASLLVLLSVPPCWDWVGAYAAAASGFVTSIFLQGLVDSDTGSFLSALAVGVVGSGYARLTRRHPLSIVVAGILLLVPGGMGVRGVTAFMENDVVGGIQAIRCIVCVCVFVRACVRACMCVCFHVFIALNRK